MRMVFLIQAYLSAVVATMHVRGQADVESIKLSS
jgi:hypothetical protein